MLTLFANRASFARLFGGAVISQALLSITNLLTGLILIRRAPQVQYGYYVLIVTAVPLLALLQSGFITPHLTSRVTTASDEERRSYVGGLLREQRQLLAILVSAGLGLCGVAWIVGILRSDVAIIVALGVLAASASLIREFFRAVLVSFRRPYDVLRADLVFAGLLVGGVWLSTLTRAPAALSALTMAVAAILGGWSLARALWRHDRWNIRGAHGALAKTVRLGTWSATGSVVHWLFTQGYTYIVAARLDVSSVAAIAATRLLLSPLGVFSIGITTVMFSTSMMWLKHHGTRGLLTRVLLFAAAMGCAAIVYILIMWSFRDWIFLSVMKKDFPQRDLLLGMWSLVFLFTVIRDQVIFLLIAQAQFKRLAGLTLFCAILGLSVSAFAIQHMGAAGGLLGLLAGEIAHTVGVLLLTVREIRNGVSAAPVVNERVTP